ncbi:unnamed protein product, partial [Ixodes pacificus]
PDGQAVPRARRAQRPVCAHGQDPGTNGFPKGHRSAQRRRLDNRNSSALTRRCDAGCRLQLNASLWIALQPSIYFYTFRNACWVSDPCLYK